MYKLSDSTKEQLKEQLVKILYNGMFGDGLEREYIMDGVSFKGLNNMTDEELVDEYDRCVCEDDTLLLKAREELYK